MAFRSFDASFSSRLSSSVMALNESSTSDPKAIHIGASCSACIAPAMAALRLTPRL
mgnify:CR=1 FL=1|jgi:hypothetical protein